uniref:Thioredoxin domain-containing protein 17 n=1 Tax=Tabanus bromius TaxID=304241 RepID=A0A0K8TNN5_TABBR
MVVEHHVKGYEEFTKLVEDLETSGTPIHVLFSGGKEENGLSWCPYCVKAEPVIQEALTHAPEKSHFIHVDVGERAYWKDKNCPFRKDPRTHLVFLPTLLRWKSPQRLDGERCSSKDLVEMLFSDED